MFFLPTARLPWKENTFHYFNCYALFPWEMALPVIVNETCQTIFLSLFPTRSDSENSSSKIRPSSEMRSRRNGEQECARSAFGYRFSQAAGRELFGELTNESIMVNCPMHYARDK